MIVVGIDFDSFEINAVSLPVESNDARWDRIRLETGPGDALDRCRRVRDLMPARGAWNDAGVIAVGLERPMGPSRLGSHAMIRVQGAILACLPREPLVAELAPGVWKKHSVGRGNATKADVKEWALAHWETNVEPAFRQDAFDAFCIAWAVRSMLEREAVAA